MGYSFQCFHEIYGGNGKVQWTTERHALGRTHGSTSIKTASNIDHEPCHYTDGVTRMEALQLSPTRGVGTNDNPECKCSVQKRAPYALDRPERWLLRAAGC
jgi:hypothetical protein